MRLVKSLSIVLLLGLTAAPALAAESWFADPSEVGDIPRFFREPSRPALVCVAALIIAILCIVLDRRRERGRVLALFGRLSPWTPTAVGILTAVALFAAALDRTLFAPDLHVPDGAFGTWAVAAELAVALLFLSGFFARPAALGLLLLAALAGVWNGAAAFEALVMPGIAAFILVWGRGRLSLGSVFGRVFYAMDAEHARPVATTALRLLSGATIIALAVGKIARPDLHFRLLDAFPVLNPYVLTKSVLPFVSRDWYLLVYAELEALLGLLIAAGAFIRPLSLATALLFLVSAAMFGFTDFIFNLPLIAALLALAVLGRDKGQ